MALPHVFAPLNGPIPLSYLDDNFNQSAQAALANTGGWFPAGSTTESALSLLGERGAERVDFMLFVTDSAVRATIRAGTCTTDLVAEFAAWRAVLAADPVRRVGYLPAGVYPYSVSPNWAIDRLAVVSDGARLRYLGTETAFLADSTLASAVVAVSPFCYSVRWRGRTYIEAPSTAKNGVFLRSVHHSLFESFNVRGAGATFSGLAVQFAVATSFPHYSCSGNEGGWYLGAAPRTGISLDKYTVGADNGDTSYCMFENPIVEGTTIGVDLANSLGTQFIGGTFEGCSQTGVVVSATSRQDKFIGVDLEANATQDFLLAGFGTVISDCDTLTKIVIQSGGYDNKITGGRHVAIDMQAGSHHNSATNLVYDRLTTGATLGDSGTYNSFAGSRKPSSPFIGRPLSIVSVPATGSGMVVSNTTGDPQYLTLTGGTGVSI